MPIINTPNIKRCCPNNKGSGYKNLRLPAQDVSGELDVPRTAKTWGTSYSHYSRHIEG